MTERAFRKGLLTLWLWSVAIGLLVTRVLSITPLAIGRQKAVFELLWLGAMLLGVILYCRGSSTSYLEREKILAAAHVKGPGWVVVSCSMFLLLMMQGSLGLGIWVGRTAVSWMDIAVLLLRLLFVLGISARVFEIVRNAHLSRMQRREG